MKNSNSLLKIEFLNKNWSFTTVCKWSDKKGKTQTFAEKVAQTAIFDIVSQLYSITCFEFPFSRILAMVLKDVEHQS